MKKVRSVEAMDGSGDNSPLHLAVRSIYMLQKRFFYRSYRQKLQYPLHLGGHTHIAELILDQGSSIEALNNDGNSPLHLATRGGHTDTVELLLNKGASIEGMGKDKNTGTPLHLFAHSGNTVMVELLLKKGA